MNPKLKRIFLALLFLAIAVGIAVLIFYTFFAAKGPAVTNTNGDSNVNGGTLPNINGAVPTNYNSNSATNSAVIANTNSGLPVIAEVAAGGLTLTSDLTQQAVGHSTSSLDGNGVYYYDYDQSKFFRIAEDGLSKSLLSDQSFYSVSNVIWSPTKDKAILEYPDGSKIMYDFRNKRQHTLPSEYQEIEFAENGREIVFKYMTANEDDRWLAIANPDGTGMQVVEHMGTKTGNFDVNYSPTGQVVANFKESTGAEKQEIYFVGKYGENFKSMTVLGKGFESAWAPEGDKMLYSVYSSGTQNKPSLHVVGAEGENIGSNMIELGLNTWPDKCTFSGSSSAICAVPVNLQEGSGPFRELANDNPDTFWQIDLNTGQKSQLAIPVNSDGSGQFQAGNMFVDETGQYLFYTDNYTGRIYKIRLQ